MQVPQPLSPQGSAWLFTNPLLVPRAHRQLAQKEAQVPEDAQGSARFKPGSWVPRHLQVPPGHLGAVTLRSWSGS